MESGLRQFGRGERKCFNCKKGMDFTFARRTGGSIPVLFLALLSNAPLNSQAPVAAIAGQRFRVTTAAGSATIPFLISGDWSRPRPDIRRVVVIFHGKGRDVKGDYRAALEAAARAGSPARETLFIAPQFLDQEDADAHLIPEDVLRWRRTEWESGSPASAPIPVSSYEVVDAMLIRLADRTVFPGLTTIVLAGHSGGAQLVQRYAIVGRAPVELSGGGIHFRFVIANASSYLYFSDERPAAGGALLPFRSRGCMGFNHWKYGTLGGTAYLSHDVPVMWPRMEADYANRDVIYLLGTADTDPHEKDLDVSCSGEAQGPTRFARGQAYYAYLHSRNGAAWNQRMWFVPGVAHSARQMITSTCGIDALFDISACPDR
jgi:hypothetical protein